VVGAILRHVDLVNGPVSIRIAIRIPVVSRLNLHLSCSSSPNVSNQWVKVSSCNFSWPSKVKHILVEAKANNTIFVDSCSGIVLIGDQGCGWPCLKVPCFGSYCGCIFVRNVDPIVCNCRGSYMDKVLEQETVIGVDQAVCICWQNYLLEVLGSSSAIQHNKPVCLRSLHVKSHKVKIDSIGVCLLAPRDTNPRQCCDGI
jgi:hypothetical protein